MAKNKATPIHARAPPAARPLSCTPPGRAPELACPRWAAQTQTPQRPPSRGSGRLQPLSLSREVKWPTQRSTAGRGQLTLRGRRARVPGRLRGQRLRPIAGRQAPVSWQQPGKKKRGKGRVASRRNKQKKPEVDIFSPAAMRNLYYIAHNVADCLRLRGFRWPGAPKSKKGKSKT
ncbi:small lysine-rich protein 1 [Hipposideros larvatus]